MVQTKEGNIEVWFEVCNVQTAGLNLYAHLGQRLGFLLDEEAV